MKPSKVGRGGSPGGAASGAGGAGAPTSPLTTTTTGPGTGSMKGTCSICGDRATKVAVIIQLLFKNMPRIVAVPIQPLLHNLLFLLSGVLQTISGSWKAHQFLMQVFNKILNRKILVNFSFPIGWWPAVQLPRPIGRSAKRAGVIW